MISIIPEANVVVCFTTSIPAKIAVKAKIVTGLVMVNKNVERKSDANPIDLFLSIGFLPGLSKTIFIPKYNKNSQPIH